MATITATITVDTEDKDQLIDDFVYYKGYKDLINEGTEEEAANPESKTDYCNRMFVDYFAECVKGYRFKTAVDTTQAATEAEISAINIS